MFHVLFQMERLKCSLFLNAVELEELYCLIKENGYTKIYKVAEDEQIRRLWEAGDLLGDLWRQDLLSDGVEKL